VRALVSDVTSLYAGGSFTTIAGQPRRNLAGFWTVDGSLKNWGLGDGATVRALVLDGPALYVARHDNTTSPDDRISVVDTSTGMTGSWSTTRPSSLTSMVVRSGTLYVGGNLQPNRLFALNAATGASVPTWDPQPDQAVHAVAASPEGV
jgi:hypothetical protein